MKEQEKTGKSKHPHNVTALTAIELHIFKRPMANVSHIFLSVRKGG